MGLHKIGLFAGAVILILGMAGMVLCQPQEQVKPENYEPPPVFKAKDVLMEGKLFQDSSYRIADEVSAEDMMCSFSVWSRFDSYYPGSLDMLYVRLSEIEALEELDKIQRDPQFIEGMAENVKEVAKGVGNIITDPVNSVAAIPLGMGKLAGGLWAHINDQEGSRRGKQTSMGFLYAKEKRKLACQLGVDPYSDNAELQEALNSVASNRNFGQWFVRIGSILMPGGVGVVLLGTQLNKSLQLKVMDNSPAELQQYNQGVLKELSCPDNQVQAFLTNPAYSPTNQTVIAGAMQDLKEVKDINRYLECVQYAPKIETVMFNQRNIQMAQAFNQHLRRLKNMTVVSDLPLFTDGEGKNVMFLSVDYLYWNEWVDQSVQAVRAALGNSPGGELWITGQASALARQRLAEKGVTIQDRVAEKLWAKQ